MERGHQLVVWVVEISDLTLEELDQLEGREFHEEVLDAPLFVLLADFILSIDHLCIDIAA
jgi:hypothetical protein